MVDEQLILRKLEIALERKIYKKSFYEFFKVAFAQLHPGKALDDNWHIKYLCDILQGETERILRKENRRKDLIINIPPRSLKSYITSIIWPVWCWTMDPSLKIATISYGEDIALIMSRISKNLIEGTWFQRLYGTKVVLKSNVSGAGHYETTMTGIRKAVGMAGGITGTGYDILLLDDPQNPKKAASEVERENTIELFNNTIFNRLNDAEIGLRVVIQQRLHERDLTGYLMDPKDGAPEDWFHISIPAEFDAEVISPPELKQFYDANGLFAPLTFPKTVLDLYRKRGVLYFAGQYQQRPVPPEGNLFKRKWFNIVEAEEVLRDPIASPIHFFIDTAYTEDETKRNDPTGILAAFKKGNQVYIINFTEVWLEFPDLIKFIQQYVAQTGYSNSSCIYIEPKANGKSVVQALKAATSMNVVEIEGDYLRDDKVARATGVSPVVQAGRVSLIRGQWTDKYVGQMVTFPKAQHDEAVDTTVYMLNQMSPANDFFFAML